MKIIKCILIFLLFLFYSACEDKRPIKIGYLAGFSGNYNSISVSGREALQLLINYWNDHDGINGRPLGLVSRDTQGNVKRIDEILDDLESQGVEFVVGSFESAMAMPVIQAIKNRPMLVMSPSVSTEQVSAMDDNFLRTAMSSGTYGKVLAQLMSKHEIKRISVILDLSNALFTQEVYDTFKQSLNKDQIIVAEHIWPLDEDIGFTGLVNETIESKAQACLLLTTGTDGVAIIQQFHKYGSNISFYGAAWVKINELVQHGGRAIGNTYVVSAFEAQNKSPAYLEFKKDYENHFHEDLSLITVYMHDAASILFQALKATKSTDPELVKEWIIKTSKFQGLEHEITIDKYGDSIKPFSIFRINQGKYDIIN